MAQIISIPQRNYDHLKKIIIAYATHGESVTNDSLADKYDIKRGSVSVSNPFLIDMGIIEHTSKRNNAGRKITETGKSLGFALDNYPADIQQHWNTLISGKPRIFFDSLLKEIDDKKLSTKNDIREAIYKVANVDSAIKRNTDYKMGAYAIIDILVAAKYLKKTSSRKYKLLNRELLEIKQDLSPMNKQGEKKAEANKIMKQSRRVFIVHGHDTEMKTSVARFLEKLELDTVILEEREDKNRTIIEKVLDYAEEIGYAVVLLSPDDYGYSVRDGAKAKKPRARQNVILELGLFLGKYGKDKVVLIIKDREKLEFPSDYTGVLVKEYDGSNGTWKLGLLKELTAWGFDIDANKLT